MNTFNQIVTGLVLLGRYHGCDITTEIGTLYAGPYTIAVSSEDAERLIALDWFWEKGMGAWAHTV